VQVSGSVGSNSASGTSRSTAAPVGLEQIPPVDIGIQVDQGRDAFCAAAALIWIELVWRDGCNSTIVLGPPGGDLSWSLGGGSFLSTAPQRNPITPEGQVATDASTNNRPGAWMDEIG
jgi:hypothetical protein